MRRGRKFDTDTRDLFETQRGELERFAEQFAAELRRAADHARKEEDIRVAVERQLQTLGQNLNVRIEGQHEYTLLRGEVDSVYGSVFVEYKNPSDAGARLDASLSAPGTRQVVEQIKGRFADVATLTGRSGKMMVGIGCDGRYFVFCRFVSGDLSVEEPVPVSRWSARRFLWSVLNLGTRGFALTPQALAEDFGSESERAAKGISAFRDALHRHEEEPRVRTFFQQWKILFGEVCGYDMANPRAELRILAEKYGRAEDNAVDILFALHTYYALFMKLLAAHVLSQFQHVGGSPISDVERAPTAQALRDRLRRLEDGDVYAQLGVTNFLEGDLFSWYLSAWTSPVEDAVRSMAAGLLEYNPNSLRDNPVQARDLLKKLYQQLVPHQVRHDLGEYYTPDWLAEQTLTAAGYEGDPKVRVLDPSCGSGTFLVLALARIQRWLERNFENAPPSHDVARLAAKNIQGFDLNPLAVLAARTNFVIQFYDLFDYRGTLEVPIYLCDSVLTPSEYGPTEQGELFEKPVPVPTSAKIFHVPREVTTDRNTLAKYCNILAEYARSGSGFTADDFLTQCRTQGVLVSESVKNQHKQLFDDIRALDKDRRNGVWARFIKNAFAPVFLKNERVDLVVGNPPWVNWESLPGRMEAAVEEGEQPNYRQQIAEVFKRYGLFSLSGSAGRLGGGKKDLSMLFVYACTDHYLKDGGTLAFIITQTVFKTKGAGDGFRRFEYTENGDSNGKTVHLNVREVDDLSDFQPFEGATNRTAIFVCRRARKPVKPPYPYTVWTKTRRGRLATDETLGEVRHATRRQKMGAIPVDAEKPTSPWLTAPKVALSALRKVMAKSHYRAHAGVYTGGLNGCYWVRVLREVPGGVLIENLYNVGKIKVDKVQCTVEKDLLYPLLRGRDVQRWRADPSAHLILAQDPATRTGIPEPEMRRRFPKTYSYLKRFEQQLRQRSSSSVRRLIEKGAFYSMFAVGEYTMALWKVLWPEVGYEVTAAVYGRRKRVDSLKLGLPAHTLICVALADADEAFFLCALLNSSPARLLLRGYVVLHPSPHVLQHVAVPRFERQNKLHRTLSDLSEVAHQAAAKKRAAKLADVEAEIDEAAAELWGLKERELAAIQRALRSQRGDAGTSEEETPSLLDDAEDA
jgi:hypothetical protein